MAIPQFLIIVLCVTYNSIYFELRTAHDRDKRGSGTCDYEVISAPFEDYIIGDALTSATSHLPLFANGVNVNTNSLTLPAYSITRVIKRNAPLVISLIATENPICDNTSTTLTASNYTCPIGSLQWKINGTTATPPLGVVLTTKDVLQINPTTPCTYTVSVTDGAGLPSTVTISVNARPTLTVSSNPVVPINLCGAEATLTATCTTFTSFIWTPTYGITSHVSANVVKVAPDSTTDYIVYAADGTCWVSSEANKLNYNSLKPKIKDISDPFVKCIGGSGFVLFALEKQPAIINGCILIFRQI